MIEELMDAGVNGFRLNFSHKDHDYFQPLFGLIRASAKKKGVAACILQDLQGPKIRVGNLEGGNPVKLIPGARLVLTTRDVPGNAMMVSTTYSALPSDVKPGN